MNNYRFYLTVCLILCFLSGCRQELPMIRSEVEYVTMPSDPQFVEGFFLVNEGNMGSNKCTIDHLTHVQEVISAIFIRNGTLMW